MPCLQTCGGLPGNKTHLVPQWRHFKFVDGPFEVQYQLHMFLGQQGDDELGGERQGRPVSLVVSTAEVIGEGYSL